MTFPFEVSNHVEETLSKYNLNLSSVKNVILQEAY